MNNKYEFTEETISWDGKILHRIKALRTIEGIVNKGDLGGLLEAEDNLSIGGNAWVYGDAKVYDNARVSGNAWVYDMKDR